MIISVRMTNWFPFCLCFSRRRRAALHPFSSVFLFSQSSAALLFVQLCPSFSQSPRNPSPPAPLLEHRDLVCPTSAVLHTSACPLVQRRGRSLPVDCRSRIVIQSQHRSNWGMYFKIWMYVSSKEKKVSLLSVYVLSSLDKSDRFYTLWIMWVNIC